MRATLQSTSIITGSKEMHWSALTTRRRPRWRRRATSTSSRSSEVGGFDAITRSAAELLTKLNRIEYDKIGKSIENAAAGLDTTINGAQMQRTLAALEKAMVDVQDIAKKLDTEGTPALEAPAGDRPAAAGIADLGQPSVRLVQHRLRRRFALPPRPRPPAAAAHRRGALDPRARPISCHAIPRP